ncbi:unnamed protein product [Urochloa humidicola]
MYLYFVRDRISAVGLVAVQLDARAQLTCELVLRDALQQLRIPSHVHQFEEPVTRSEEGYSNSENSKLPELRAAETTLLSYDIIIHLNCVEDYHSLSSSSSGGSFESDVSGLPSTESLRRWPARHKFDSRLGQPDALPDPPRASVHSRLGSRRDRFRLLPPVFGGAGPSVQRNNAGGSYQGRHHVGRGQFRWQVKHSSKKIKPTDISKTQAVEDAQVVQRQTVEPAGAFLVHAISNEDLCKFDPMMEEAAVTGSGCCLPMSSQCSVEPTAADRAVEAPASEPEQGAVKCGAQGSIHKGLHVSPGLDEPMFGRLFDLNQDYHSMEGTIQPDAAYEQTHGAEIDRATEDSRVILGAARGD